MIGLRSLCLVMLLVPIGSGAQPGDNNSPTAVVRQFFQAQAEGRWVDAAHLLNLQAFEPYREDALKQARMGRNYPAPTVERIMASDPQMPRVVAEYVAKRYAFPADSDQLSLQFARTSSTDALAALPLDQAAARWLEARGPRWQFERAVGHLGPKCVKPNAGQVPGEAPKEVLEPAIGSGPGAQRADSVSYVLFREVGSNPSGRISKGMPVGVVTLTSINGQWKILPLQDLGYAGGMRTFTTPACTMVQVQETH